MTDTINPLTLLCEWMLRHPGVVITDWFECGCGVLVDPAPDGTILLRVIHTCEETA